MRPGDLYGFPTNQECVRKCALQRAGESLTTHGDVPSAAAKQTKKPRVGISPQKLH